MGNMLGFAHLIEDESWSSGEPVHFVIMDPPDGTSIGFEFWGEAEAGNMAFSEIYWAISSMNVTAYGDNLSFRQSTWGSIKYFYY
jgi:hypothetical protein